jgi:actin-like ATPase involved in cell morphogenesis
MTYSLGIDLGTTFTSAAIHEGSRSSIVELSDRSSTIPSVVFLADDGTYYIGDAATRRTLMDPARAASQFKRRFGDTAPLMLGGTPLSADQLSAHLLRSVVDQVTQRQGRAPDHIAVTHPAGWGGYKLELLDQTIRAAGLGDVTAITEPEAAVLHYSSLERIPPDAVVAVFDLGGGTFDAAVIRKTEAGTEFLGRPDGIERLGGIDFDAAILAFVAGHLDGAIDQLDLDEPTHRSALERLRTECVDAKEALSVDEMADIPVLLPTAQTTVRITRAEFEAAIRPAIAQAIDALQRAIASAGLEPSQLDAILLAGGSSRIPLVAEMLTSELGRPVAVDAHPKQVVALGAARAAGTEATVSEGPLRVTPPTGIVPLEAGAAALAAAAESTPTAPAVPIIIPQTPTGPVEAFDPDATTTIPAAAAATTTMGAVSDNSGLGATTAMPLTDSPIPVGPPAGGVDTEPVGAGEPSNRALIITIATAAFLLIGGIVAFALASGGDDPVDAVPATSAASVPATVATVPGIAPQPTDSPSTPAPTSSPATDPPTTDPAPAPPPYPPETRRTELTGITVVDGVYEITYDTINFEPLIADYHVHFHWNTFAPGSVGTASDPIGEWIVWDLDDQGRKVFDQFSPNAIPAGATQICAIVADSSHAVDAPEWVDDTVSCVDIV